MSDATIALLIPLLGRAHQIGPLLANIAETTKVAYRVFLICSPDDEALPVAKASGALTLVADWAPDRGDYAKKLTLGVQQSVEPWLFQGASDLKFSPGWDEQALYLGDRHHKGVVGTNDLGNPGVMRGRQSTHSLVSRHYIENIGATYDGSGAIFSERYDHQYTDIEFVETAKWRKQWIFSHNSQIEHLHPLWGKGEMDATYEKALRDGRNDGILFQERRKDRLQHYRP